MSDYGSQNMMQFDAADLTLMVLVYGAAVKKQEWVCLCQHKYDRIALA